MVMNERNRKIYFEHWSLVPSSVWVWKDFNPREIACRGNGSILIDRHALSLLQLVRDEIGKPVFINSAYRSRLHNARIGGAPFSRHKLGDAFDISLRNQNRQDLYEVCRDVGFTGFGSYSSFFHIDCGPNRKWGKKWKQMKD